AVLFAVRCGLQVLARFVAGDRLLEGRELDDDEAVEFLRALEDLELAAARQELAAELLEDAGCQVSGLLVLIGIVDLRARDPVADHLILHPTFAPLPAQGYSASLLRGSGLSRANGSAWVELFSIGRLPVSAIGSRMAAAANLVEVAALVGDTARA